MSNYKRLTKKDWGNMDLTKEYGYLHIYKRLAELENKIEDGTLIELPCKIGDTIYVVPSEVNFRLNKLFHGGELNRVHKQPVVRFSVYPTGTMIYTCDGVEAVSLETYGESWFLTEEEANKRLEELENANSETSENR